MKNYKSFYGQCFTIVFRAPVGATPNGGVVRVTSSINPG